MMADQARTCGKAPKFKLLSIVHREAVVVKGKSRNSRRVRSRNSFHNRTKIEDRRVALGAERCYSYAYIIIYKRSV